MSYGENLAQYTHGVDSSHPMVEAWVSEKNNYHPGELLTLDNLEQVGHYTQMVWRTVNSVGCGMATTSDGADDFLVCRYSVSQSGGHVPY